MIPAVYPTCENISVARFVGLTPSQFNIVNGQNFALTPATELAPGGYDYYRLNAVTPIISNQPGPDGALTASKIVEDNTLSQHRLHSANISLKGVISEISVFYNVPLRLVLIAKAAERTRMVVTVLDTSTPNGDGAETGDLIRVGFDLAGGNIGYANSTVNWTIDSATMTQPFGNSGSLAGWWMVTIDFRRTGPNVNFYVLNIRLALDNGSGTAAISPGYTGDNSSGALLWYMSFLPKAAWDLTQESFRDDFTSLSTIDINDTRQPGFNWYVHNSWPNTSQIGSCWQTSDVATPDFFSQSGSVLTIAGAVEHSCGIAMTSVAPDISDPTKLVRGFTWRPPAIIECCFAFDPTLPGGILNNGGGGGTFMISPTIGTDNPFTYATEIDPQDSCIKSGSTYLGFFDMNSGTDQGVTAGGAPSGSYGLSITDFRQFAVMIINPSVSSGDKGFGMAFWRNPYDTQIKHSMFSRNCISKAWNRGHTTGNSEYMTLMTGGRVGADEFNQPADIPIPTAFDWYRVISPNPIPPIVHTVPQTMYNWPLPQRSSYPTTLRTITHGLKFPGPT